MADLSQFTCYSIGIASQNKLLTETILHVCPIEVTPYLDGELTAGVTTHSEQGLDKDGKEYVVTVNQSSSVKATWLRLGHTNRRSAPDVRRGERVLLYTYGDSDALYWDSMGMDDHLRKLETVITSWSATKDETLDSTSYENSYSLEVSTHDKLVTFRTVKVDGEPFAYTFQLNTKDGRFIVTDDDNNWIELDSMERRITLENRDTTRIVLDKRDINIHAPNDLNVDIEHDVNVTIGNNFNMTVGGTYNTLTQGSYKSDAKGGMELIGGGTKVSLTSGGYTCTAVSVNYVQG